jgi:hypothetical protein
MPQPVPWLSMAAKIEARDFAPIAYTLRRLKSSATLPKKLLDKQG